MLLPILLAVAALAQQGAPSTAPQPVRQLALWARTHHVQGIDSDGVTLWVTSVDRASKKGYLMAFSARDGSLQRSVELQEGDRYHPGGIDAEGDSVWVPVAEYKAHSTAAIQRRNRRTLALEFQFQVPDHIGCIAVTPDYLIGGNWDSRDFYVWDHKGRLIRKVQSTTGNSYQDLKWVSGRIVGSGTLANKQAAVDWLEFPALTLASRILPGNTERGQPYTREGMTVVNDEVWFLPEDDESKLYVFPLAALP